MNLVKTDFNQPIPNPLWIVALIVWAVIVGTTFIYMANP